ncbi:hypothetical protein [Flavobacterium sp.]|uniref:hypothetical protein n=1 Tax=Flavobacterium sp. TaxID=239 RepID=UPI00375364EE
MATTVITIRLDGNGPGIILNDGQSNGSDITTNVQNGDTVKWKLLPNSGISSLNGINDLTTDVFNPDPTKQPDGSYQGTVAATAGQEESYNVLYTIAGVKYYHDPKIHVNP